MTLTSTGVEWDEDSLAKRYAFFRKVRNEVRLDLLYYPYWVIELHGRATWRFFGQKAAGAKGTLLRRRGGGERVRDRPRGGIGGLQRVVPGPGSSFSARGCVIS